MKKMNVIKMLVQGVVLIATVGGFYIYTQKEVNPKEVYVYSRNISANTKIQDVDLIKKYIPNDAVTKDMITKKEDAVGKYLITKGFTEEYALKQQLVSEEDVDPFAKIDLNNYRKVAIEIESKDAVGGNLKKGDLVDLAYVGTSESSQNKEDFTYGKIFMPKVLVYNVIDDGGRQYIDQTEGASTVVDSNGDTVDSGSMSIVVVAVTPEQAEQLEVRKKTGTVSVIGRFNADDSDEGESVTAGYIIGDYNSVSTEEADPEN